MSSAPPAPDSSPPRAAGSVIAGRYQIESLLGQGGMGDVYLVRHTVMRKRLALKLLRPEVSRVPEFAARFEREAMAASTIDHPNVAAASDCGKDSDGTLFLALEYIEGRSVRQALLEGALPAQRALHIAHQVASAMKRTHQLGIIHRDLKPDNIMLTSRHGDPDFVKVLDFGLAKLSADSAASDPGAVVQKLTQLGEIFGTPQYMAPEQTTGGEVDARSDLYALGIILYEMLTGCLPFEAKDASEFLKHQLRTPLPAFAKRAPQIKVPDGAEALVRRLCEKLPEKRFQSAEELSVAIEEVAKRNNLVLTPPRTESSSPSLSNVQSRPLPAAPATNAPAPGQQGMVFPKTASMVMFLGAVERAQKRLPRSLQGVAPEKLGFWIVLSAFGLIAIVSLLIWLLSSD